MVLVDFEEEKLTKGVKRSDNPSALWPKRFIIQVVLLKPVHHDWF